MEGRSQTKWWPSCAWFGSFLRSFLRRGGMGGLPEYAELADGKSRVSGGGLAWMGVTSGDAVG